MTDEIETHPDTVRAMTFEQYADWLSDCSQKAYGVRTIPREFIMDMGNGLAVYVERLMFHWTLKTTQIGDPTGHEGRWCYEGSSPIRVLTALAEWKSRDWKDKPTGWRREPYTGLRRNDDGDPATERYAP